MIDNSVGNPSILTFHDQQHHPVCQQGDHSQSHDVPTIGKIAGQHQVLEGFHDIAHRDEQGNDQSRPSKTVDRQENPVKKIDRSKTSMLSWTA